MAIHDRAYTRAKTWTKAIRKYHMAPHYYDNLHQFADNKIHCSCPLCASKTNNKNRKTRGHEPSKNWSITDKKKLEDMKNQINEEI